MDIALHCTERGSGEPLVLLHGNGEDSTFFEHQLDMLARRFRVIALDTRGHGLSPRGTAPFTLDQFACDLGTFMDERGIEAAHLFGFSDGANIAILFALANPKRVRSLVLNGGNLFPEGLEPEVRAEDAAAYQEALAAHDEHQLALLRLMMDEPHIDPAALFAIRVPTLVVAGTQDVIAPDHTRLIAQSIPGAQLRFVEGDHFVAAGNPDAFNRVLAEFYGL
ncbi:MAG: alpha/beta fold hydrolase [Coriobacteriia bacterium]|nr:alpha/beta fold hydrolase [Coriobacteriia bacterium]